MKQQGQPDGAKPGDAVHGPADKHAFNADERAEAREAAPITIGEVVFHRRRKNWEVTRALRKLLRVQERAGNKAQRLRARISALTIEIRGVQDQQTGEWTRPPLDDEARIDAIDAQVEELETQVDAADLEADTGAYEIIALLIQGDDGNAPDVEHLKEKLDVEEAGEIANFLANGGEQDPTPETQSSSS